MKNSPATTRGTGLSNGCFECSTHAPDRRTYRQADIAKTQKQVAALSVDAFNPTTRRRPEVNKKYHLFGN